MSVFLIFTQGTHRNVKYQVAFRMSFQGCCLIEQTYLQSWGRGGGTLNVAVTGMLVGNFLENPKKYPDFDFKPLQNTQIAILRAVLGKMASIFQKLSRRP